MSPDAAQSLAGSLEPVLAEQCNHRLGKISWFKTDWQRGGAATGSATYTCDDGNSLPVVVKLPIVRRELLWTQRLQNCPPDSSPVPRLFASGESLANYDMAWIVIEKFEHGPLGLRWHEDHIPRIARSVAAFHKAASEYEIDQGPRIEDWWTLVDEAIESVSLNIAESKREWAAALKQLRSRLDELVAEWRARAVDQWLHGDVHLANAMSRDGMESGCVSLIDLAEVHAGHWVEDAVYLERQLWARPERMKKHKPVKAIAQARKQLGLPVGKNDSRLAMIRRALLAATAPKFIRTEGNPKHLQACLTWLERALAELA